MTDSARLGEIEAIYDLRGFKEITERGSNWFWGILAQTTAIARRFEERAERAEALGDKCVEHGPGCVIAVCSRHQANLMKERDAARAELAEEVRQHDVCEEALEKARAEAEALRGRVSELEGRFHTLRRFSHWMCTEANSQVQAALAGAPPGQAPCPKCGFALEEHDDACPPRAPAKPAQGGLVPTLNEVRRAFKSAPGEEPSALTFWLNLLDQQIIEARDHLKAGRNDKAMNEIADLYGVGWQALLEQGVDPEAFIVKRCTTHTIPGAAKFKARDLPGNGYKPPAPAKPAQGGDLLPCGCHPGLIARYGHRIVGCTKPAAEAPGAKCEGLAFYYQVTNGPLYGPSVVPPPEEQVISGGGSGYNHCPSCPANQGGAK